jgi:hypothetical protein
VAPLTCGGGGVPGACGNPTCVAETCAQQNIACGPAGDGCGNTIQCGGCDAGTCGGAGIPGQCGVACAPLTCAQQGLSCGPAGDGCGNILDGGCGNCAPPLSCGGGGVPGACGMGLCVPETCASQSYNCGEAGDGCGGIITCGVCDGGTCGGNGKANVCGTKIFE